MCTIIHHSMFLPCRLPSHAIYYHSQNSLPYIMPTQQAFCSPSSALNCDRIDEIANSPKSVSKTKPLPICFCQSCKSTRALPLRHQLLLQLHPVAQHADSPASQPRLGGRAVGHLRLRHHSSRQPLVFSRHSRAVARAAALP